MLRFLLWFVAPLDDRYKGLSLARLLSIWCFLMVQDVVEKTHTIRGWDYAVLLLGAALWVGKKGVLVLLAKQQTKVEGKDVTERIDLRTLPNAKTDDERG